MIKFMNKMTAIFGTLALAGTLTAATALADTSKTSAAKAAPSILDKMVLSYWAWYSGPSLGDPGYFSYDSGKRGAVGQDGDVGTGPGGEIQNLDSTITLGYKVTNQLVLSGNYRFVVRPGLIGGQIEGAKVNTPFVFRNKDPWITLVAPKLIHYGAFNMSADIRFYIPAMSSAVMYGAIRMTQVSTYDVPKTRLSVGLFTYERTNFLTDAGASGAMENLALIAAPFASYQLIPTLSATLWSDVIQATYAVNGGDVLQGWDNPPVDVSLGVAWDITPKLNVNPQVTFFPGYATIHNTTIGAVISAKFL